MTEQPKPSKLRLNLEQVIERIRMDERLTLKQRQERISAVTSTCKWLHRTPAEIPADPAWLRLAVGRLTPAAVRVSVGRFNNVRSLLATIMRELGITSMERRDRVAIAPQWRDLLDLIEVPAARGGVVRFVRFLSESGIAPEDISDSAAQAYLTHLGSGEFQADAFRVAQAVVRNWNRLVDGGWPLRRLTRLKKFERYTLTWDQVPVSLRTEIEAWLASYAGNMPDNGDLPAPRALRPDTIKARRYLLLQTITGMHFGGVELSSLRSIADLCNPERVRKALRFHLDRHVVRYPGQREHRTPTLFGIADLPRQLAKYHVNASPEVVNALTGLARQFRPAPSGMSATSQERLQQIEDPKVARDLLKRPLLEMMKLLDKPEPHRHDASRFSVLLAIALLPRMPLRIKNLADLDLDRHLRIPLRRNEPIQVTLPRGELKNAQPLKLEISGVLAQLFRAYLTRFRPLLLDQASSAVFPGKSGRPKDRKLLGRQIGGLLRREFGLAWNPHLFRHFVAYLNRAHGGDLVDTQLMLGHRTGDTTRRSYEGFDARFAFQRLDSLIDTLVGPLPAVSRKQKKPELKKPAQPSRKKPKEPR